MAHSHMDHGNMGHGDMDMDMGKCSMNMLFTWSTKDLCIVFSGWRITGGVSLLLSLLAIVALTAGYEAVREASRRYEATGSLMFLKQRGNPPRLPEDDSTDQRDSLLGSGPRRPQQDERQTRIIKALFYAAQVFYSFFIMLLFMTYNGWVMLAVAAGAFVGYLLFGQGSSTKTVACH